MAKTRLQLAVKLRKESGVAGTGPTSTINQTGEYGMLVDWIDDAYERIQSEHEDWQFLRSEFSSPLTSGVATYTPSEANISDHGSWIVSDVRCYLTATGTDNEQEIFYIPWDEFRRTYNFGTQRTETGRPVHFTVKPDKSIQFWPIPDDAYTVVGEYYKAPIVMTLDTDTPAFQDHLHLIVVWGALYFYGANYAEHDRYIHGKNEYHRMKHLLEISQRQTPEWGEPLV